MSHKIIHFHPSKFYIFFAKGKNDGTYAPQGKLTELGSLVVDLQKSYNELLSTFWLCKFRLWEPYKYLFDSSFYVQYWTESSFME